MRSIKGLFLLLAPVAACGSVTDDEPGPQTKLAIDDAGFVLVGKVRWSADPTPTIVGKIDDPRMAVEVLAGDVPLGTANVAGTAWSFTVPAGTLGLAPTELSFVGRIGRSEQVVVQQPYAIDLTPPVLGVAPSMFSDERADTVTFAPDGTITSHAHAAATVDLADCPDVFKHAYLMDPKDPNPIRFQLTATDDGVGIDLASARARVGIADGGELGTFFPVEGVTDGATATFQVDALRSGMSGSAFVGTTEGKLVMQLAVKDLLGREVQTERCWINHPLAVPLLVGDAREAVGYPLALASNALATGPFFHLASELINVGSKGLAIMDFDLFNGTDEPAIATFSLERPEPRTRRDYRRGTMLVSSTNLFDEDVIDCALQPAACAPLSTVPFLAFAGTNQVESTDRWVVRVVRIATDGQEEEVPCTTCDAATACSRSHWRASPCHPIRACSTES
ncbi:MAG: hypothetical protein KF773_03925 [Deltaproteobacteria bacterium]|nr:hypothetical protein [Deltaproteobacteria bacterium]